MQKLCRGLLGKQADSMKVKKEKKKEFFLFKMQTTLVLQLCVGKEQKSFRRKNVSPSEASIQSRLSLPSGVFCLSTFADLGMWVHLMSQDQWCLPVWRCGRPAALMTSFVLWLGSFLWLPRSTSLMTVWVNKMWWKWGLPFLSACPGTLSSPCEGWEHPEFPDEAVLDHLTSIMREHPMKIQHSCLPDPTLLAITCRA